MRTALGFGDPTRINPRAAIGPVSPGHAGQTGSAERAGLVREVLRKSVREDRLFKNRLRA